MPRREVRHGHLERPTIRRLARRGGVSRISALTYTDIKTCLIEFLEPIIADSVTCCLYARRKTVRTTDVLYALQNNGRPLYGFGDPVKKKKKNTEQDENREKVTKCRRYEYLIKDQGREGKLFKTTENIVSTIYQRIHKLLQKPYILDYGGDSAFVCVTLAINMKSEYLRNEVFVNILQPVIAVMDKNNRNDMTSVAIMVASALLLLNKPELIEKHCLPHIKVENFEPFKVLEKDTYRSLLIDSVNLYFQSWVCSNIVSFKLDRYEPVTPVEVIKEVMVITTRLWVELDQPLCFKKKNILIQTDQNRDRLYFLTHVLFIGNHYGTRPLDPSIFTPEIQEKLFRIFLGWFWQFIKMDAIKENIEEFSEVSYSLLYLSNNLGCKVDIPKELNRTVTEFIGLAEELSKEKKKHAWYPNAKGYRYDTYTDNHSLMVVASLLIESLRYKQHLHPLYT